MARKNGDAEAPVRTHSTASTTPSEASDQTRPPPRAELNCSYNRAISDSDILIKMSAERVNQENETKQVNEAKIEDETIEIKEVKYELNTVENLKKAKDNVKRSETTTRIIIDDKNIKFELNSGVYLEVKKNSLKLKKGDEICDSSIGVKMKVTLVRKTITKIKKDSPQASIYFEVKEDSTEQTAKLVQQMYHTKQVVHLQGGGRIKKTTFTSLVAHILERQWAKIKEDNQEIIAKYNDSIKTIDLGKFSDELETKNKRERKNKYH